MAFPLAMGITDPPIIALTCLGLALLARGAHTPAARPRGTRARETRARETRARETRLRETRLRETRLREAAPGWNRDFTVAALAFGVACAVKYTAWPALVIVVVMVAALPGRLLATLGSYGHLAALALLAAAGLTIVASLIVAPPATPAAAARRLAIGPTALFLLAPATRFGYFIYPISLYAWAMLADRQGGSGRRDEDCGQCSLGPVIGRLPASYWRQAHRVIGHSNGWRARQMPDAVG